MIKGDNRRSELVKIAYDKFINNGYENTSVDEIIEEAEIAKGTFYYYFKSKESLLEEVINLILENQTKKANEVLNSSISIPEKIVGIVLAYTPNERENTIKDALHTEENILLHKKLNKELIERVVPLLAEVTSEGNKIGVFNCDNVNERMRAILVLSSSLFDDDNKYTQKDIDVFIDIVEKILGAKTGTMTFISKVVGSERVDYEK